MHIFLWGFLVMALTNLNMAAPSDKVKNDDSGRENEANKSQLDMILAQLKQQQDEQQQQIHEQKKEQQLMNEVLGLLRDQIREEQLVNEVLRDQIQEQKHQLKQEIKERQHKNNEQQREIKEQRRKNDKQQQEIKELTKINRARRSENETEHLLELIRAEINHVAGLSQCQVGENNTNPEGFDQWKTITFERNFMQTPKIVASVSGFSRRGVSDMGLGVYVRKPTTTNFELLLSGWWKKPAWMKAIWIACA